MKKVTINFDLPEPNNEEELLEFLEERYPTYHKTLNEFQYEKENFIIGGFGHIFYGTMNELPIVYKIIPNVSYLSFYREIETMILGHDTFAVKILGYTTKPYGIIMERMKFSLNERINSLNPTQKTIVAISILQCLKYLHSYNKVHFDIKPENILLNDNYYCYLADFGSVRNLATESALRSYTLAYLPPEVYFNRNQKRYRQKCVDIYAYGLVLLTLMSEVPMNKNPYCENLEAMKRAGKIPEIPENTPNDLSRIIIQCTVKDPSKRPTAEDLLHEFINKRICYPGANWQDVILNLKAKVSFLKTKTQRIEISKVSLNKERIEIKKEIIDEENIKESPGSLSMDSIYTTLIKSKDMDIPSEDLLRVYKLIEEVLENCHDRSKIIQKYFIIPYLKTYNDDLMSITIEITQLYANDVPNMIIQSPEAIDIISSFRKSDYVKTTAGIYSVLLLNIIDKKEKLTTLEERLMTELYTIKNFKFEFLEINNPKLYNVSKIRYILKALECQDLNEQQFDEIASIAAKILLNDENCLKDIQERFGEFSDPKFPVDILLTSDILDRAMLEEIGLIAENPLNAISLAKSKYLSNLKKDSANKDSAVNLLTIILNEINNVELKQAILEGSVFSNVLTSALKQTQNIDEKTVQNIDSGIMAIRKASPFTEKMVKALDEEGFFQALSFFILTLHDKEQEIVRDSLMLIPKMAEHIVPNMIRFLYIIDIRLNEPVNRDSALKFLLFLIGGNERTTKKWDIHHTEVSKQIAVSMKEMNIYKSLLMIKEQIPDSPLLSTIFTIIQ